MTESGSLGGMGAPVSAIHTSNFQGDRYCLVTNPFASSSSMTRSCSASQRIRRPTRQAMFSRCPGLLEKWPTSTSATGFARLRRQRRNSWAWAFKLRTWRPGASRLMVFPTVSSSPALHRTCRGRLCGTTPRHRERLPFREACRGTRASRWAPVRVSRPGRQCGPGRPQGVARPCRAHYPRAW